MSLTPCGRAAVAGLAVYGQAASFPPTFFHSCSCSSLVLVLGLCRKTRCPNATKAEHEHEHEHEPLRVRVPPRQREDRQSDRQIAVPQPRRLHAEERSKQRIHHRRERAHIRGGVV